jgi:hypothetical protein
MSGWQCPDIQGNLIAHRVDRRPTALDAQERTDRQMAGSQEESAVARSVEMLRKGILTQDAAMLEAITMPELSYSHSNGKIEDRSTFIANATGPNVQPIALDYSDITICVVKNVAIVRLHMQSKTRLVKISSIIQSSVLLTMTWLKRGDDWVMLSRAATAFSQVTTPE